MRGRFQTWRWWPILVVSLGLAAIGGCGGAKSDSGAGGSGGRAAPTDGAGVTADGGAGAGQGITAASFALSGYLIGLHGGAVVLANAGDLLTLTADGAFTFGRRLPGGSSYAVAVEANPPGELCTAAGASGVVASADVVTVAVTCLSTDATLASLSVSPGTLTPGFAPGVTSYALPGFHTYEPAVTVTAAPTSPDATLQVAGAGVEPGIPVDLPIAPGAQTIAVTVTAASGAVLTYAVAVTRPPAVYFKPSNTAHYDTFGRALSISGDTFVVGAPGESSGATGVNGDQSNTDAPYSGAAYVFTGSDQAWSQQAYLKASNTGKSDEFGSAVALDGDTLVVGASRESSSARGVDGDQSNDDAPHSGAVYIFERTGQTWTQTAYLKASNADAEDGFGSSLALSGDTLVVGAFGESSGGADPTDNSAPNAGAVYVFERQASGWAETAYLKASNAEAGDGFGGVALDGDTLVISAAGESSSARGVGGDQNNDDAPSSGAAYVFQRGAAGSWSQIAYLKASNSAASAEFGVGVAISGDTIVVSATGDTSGATGVDGDQYTPDATAFGNVISGAAYVFVRQGGSFVQQAFLKPFTSLYSFFGPVGISGDTVVVSGNNESYGFTRSAGVWTELGLFELFDIGASVGGDLAIDGDRVLITNFYDSWAGTGVNPARSGDASFSGGVYLFQ